MILLIDWGNSYLKWMQVSSLELADIHNATLHSCNTPQELSETLRRLDATEKDAFQQERQQKYQLILIASVRSQADNWELQREVAQLGLKIHFAVTESKACGIECAYRDPTQMGVDRWLGVVAAASEKSNVAIIGLGSAITLDVIRERHHLGGQIVPGHRLLLDSLKQTGQVRASDMLDNTVELMLGRSTSECVHAGVQTLIASYLENIMDHCQTAFNIREFILTGGGSAYWFEKLKMQGRSIDYRPRLVFEGLSRRYADGNLSGC